MTTVEVSKHGVASGYNKGCRCDECSAAKAEASRLYYERNREKIRERDRLRYERNREEILERNRRWARENPAKAAEGASRRRRSNPESHRSAVRGWRERNPEQARLLDRAQNAKPETKQRRRQWAEVNRERVNAAAAKWRADPANQQKIRIAAKLRRARMRAAETCDYTASDWSRQLHRQRHRCYYCDGDGTMTADHVIPLTRGGRHAVGNIVAACKSCNSSKHNRLLIEWRSRPTF